ncbi:hypothetical protein F2Q69_00042406 [Brassica cretica]|uniref:Uncharacterized protein n=1 Tax=Brassica cretica TaxID=69181 RepID=A0A8S9NV99_BRACR|nr:hypothetical protein F2Q69_00042406 [Brassica cretica]
MSCGSTLAFYMTTLQQLGSCFLAEVNDHDEMLSKDALSPNPIVFLYLLVVKQEGWERLCGGLAPSLAGTAASQTFLLGAVAKLGATVTTYPLLVVKSRLQAKQLRLVIAPCSEKALALDS